MRRAFLLVVALAPTAFADDPFACVDPDVANAFLGSPYTGKAAYSTSFPEGFVDLSPPSGSLLIGSQTIASMTNVVFKVSMDREPALAAAVDAMAELGWTEYGDRHRSATGGFQTSRRSFSATALCNDEYPVPLTISAYANSGQTYVSYMQHTESQSCSESQQMEYRRNSTDVMHLMPKMTLPDDTEATSTGMGGNGHQFSSYVDVSGAVSRSDLADFIESQIREQGWEYQASWASHRSSGSVWASNSEDNGLLIGTLHLFDSGSDPIRVRFSVTPADPADGRNRGSWSGSVH